jgi:serine/threonine-protein kinase RIM15
LIEEAKDLITKLLKRNPSERLGAKGIQEIKDHPFFKGIVWETLLNQEAPFIPSPTNWEDTSYFESRLNSGNITPALVVQVFTVLRQCFCRN